MLAVFFCLEKDCCLFLGYLFFFSGGYPFYIIAPNKKGVKKYLFLFCGGKDRKYKKVRIRGIKSKGLLKECRTREVRRFLVAKIEVRVFTFLIRE